MASEGNGLGRFLGAMRAYGGGPVNPEAIQNAVDQCLEDHPEWTTTVEDGAVSYAKLDSGLKGSVDDVSSLKSAMSDVEDDIDEIKHGKNIPKVNYLNPADTESGKKIKSDGTLSDDSGSNTSGYCEIDTTKTYAVITGAKASDPTVRVAKDIGRFAFYASDKSFISFLTGTSFLIPNNAKYLRFSGAANALWTYDPMVEYVDNVSDISSVFVPYSDSPSSTHGLDYFDEQINEINEELEAVNPIINGLFAVLPIKGKHGGYAVNGTVGEAITETSNSSWRYAVFDIAGYNRLCFSTVIYGSTYYGIVFTTDAGIVISKELLKGSSTAETITDYWIDIPQYATKAYINKRSSTSGDYASAKVAINMQLIADNMDYGKYEFTLLAINCGAFDHDESGGTITDDQYKANWREMLNASKADLFALSDCDNTFGQLTGTPDILFGDTIRSFDNNNGFNSGLALASRLQADFIEQIDVGGENARRKIVYKYKVHLMGKDVIVYIGHYEPEQGNASVRATQYANVMADAATNKYQYVIFCGDFNAWAISEYTPFTTAGYVICNGGYTGTHLTLRDIPADNIIMSPNIMAKSFNAMTGYTLNTDHTAIVATLMLKD